MCGANKRFLFYLFLVFLLASAAGALRGEEPESWYLISETELRSIGEYKKNSEAEKQSWLLRVQELKTQATGLRQDSETLNSQLRNQRELNRKLTLSFNEYEAGQLVLISLKNGEIAALKQEAESYKGTARSRLVVIAGMGTAWIIFIAFKVRRFFRIIK